jgi:MFS family permease
LRHSKPRNLNWNWKEHDDPNGRRFKALLALGIGIFGLSFATGIQGTIYTNFLVEDIGIEAHQLGVLESIREIPGLLTAFILGFLLHVAEPLLAGASLLLVALGLGAYYFVRGLPDLIAYSFLWSLGLHCWMPLRSSMILELSEPSCEGKRLGQMNSVGFAAATVSMFTVFVASTWLSTSFRTFFLIAAIMALLASLTTLGIPGQSKGSQRFRLILRRKYGLYYGLSLLDGCRRQIFTTFATLVMVKAFGAPVSHIALLMLLNNIIGFMAASYVGSLVDRIGERFSLILGYGGAIPVFIGYALILNLNVLYILYILDSFLFIFSSIALVTYINDSVPLEDLTPSLAMGQTMNHVAAVSVPVIGGILWSILGYDKTFFMGALITLASALMALGVPKGRIRKP